MTNFQDKVGFIWSVADLLRGDYKQSEYGKVILPLTVLRRLDCVLEPTKAGAGEGTRSRRTQTMRRYRSGAAARRRAAVLQPQPVRLPHAARRPDAHRRQPERLHQRLLRLSARDLREVQVRRPDRPAREAASCSIVVQKFAEIDLHPDACPTTEMGYIFEELIRRFAEQSNETAGRALHAARGHPPDGRPALHRGRGRLLRDRGIVRTLYDPACGTGGMLSVAEERLRELNPDAKLEVFGQELNAESFAICHPT